MLASVLSVYGDDGKKGYLIDTNTGHKTDLPFDPFANEGYSISRSGDIVISYNARDVMIFEISSRTTKKLNLPLPVRSVTISSDGKLIACVVDESETLLGRITSFWLPTEAEWEYACRAGSTTPFHFGESISPEQANYNCKYTYGGGKKGPWRVKTTPVGSFPANAWGLYDMHGNVWQLCQDWYGDYSTEDLINPTGPKTGKNRVLRGGSWATCPEACRSGDHAWFEPGNGAVGFRVCFSHE